MPAQIKLYSIHALLLFFLFYQVACNEQKKTKIGLSIESFSSSRLAKYKTSFEKKILDIGGDVIIKEANDEEEQYNQAIDIINSGIDILVILPINGNTAASIVRKAHEKQIKVIAYDRLIKNTELDYFVGFDMKQTGIIQANYAVNIFPKGNYVLIEGDRADENANLIAEGHMQELQSGIASGDINILYKVFIEQWMPQVAAHEFERAYDLSNEDIDVIISANDGMASGIINAIESRQIKMPIITGLDAELNACKRIVNGKQSMTIYTSIENLAVSTAELAMEIANNKKLDFKFKTINNNRIDVPSILIQPIMLDKSNIESIIIKDGVYSKEEIWGI